MSSRSSSCTTRTSHEARPAIGGRGRGGGACRHDAAGVRGGATAAANAAGSAQLGVSAVVPARASVQVHSSPASLSISAQDVARGWIDAPGPMDIAVRTNSLRGSTIVFTGSSEHVRQVGVEGFDAPVQIAGQGGAVAVPAATRPNEPVQLRLKLRFYLAAGTPPGAHPWPLRISAAPI